MTDKVLIAIAVAHPEDLEVIPGAVPSAKRLVEWGQSQGYQTTLVTDESAPVTCSGLRKVFVEQLGPGGQERVVVAFAGHGLIRGGAEEYWLLNGWRTEATEAVNYFKLRERLATYRPRQLAIISDACRSLPVARARFVEGNGVVPVADYDPAPVHFAELYGTHAAQPAYSEPLGENEAYCFFTRVLTDALLGRIPAAVENDPREGRVVRNDLLFDAVTRELPRLASSYNRSQLPDLRGAWRSPHNVWTKLEHLPSASDPIPLPKASAAARNLGASKEQLKQESLRTEALKVAQTLDRSNRPSHYETGSGLGLDGAKVEFVAAGSSYEVERDPGGPQWFRVSPGPAPSAAFVLHTNYGWWVGGALYAGFITAVTADEHGASSVVLRRIGRDSEAPAVRAIARLLTGQQSIGNPYEVAAKLRDKKHEDPVLGALASYAYARIGEVDEIRRLLYYYAQQEQPAPFDAVMLAQTPVTRTEFGFETEVPAVIARKPRSPAEASRMWSFSATPASTVRVAGSFPWLREGWPILEDDRRPAFREIWKQVLDGSPIDSRGLAPAPFTTFGPDTGSRVAHLIRRGEL